MNIKKSKIADKKAEISLWTRVDNKTLSKTFHENAPDFWNTETATERCLRVVTL